MINLRDIGLYYKKDIEERYYQTFGKSLDLKDPMTFSEKMQWLKIFGNTARKAKYADKATLRNIVEKCVGKEFCLPCISIYEKNHIEGITLKPNTILKCSHGSGMNIRIADTTNRNFVLDRLRQFTNYDYSTKCFEPWYHFIRPRVIEEAIIDNKKEIKAWCFNGQVLFFEAFEILKNGIPRASFYDLKWSFMDWLRPVKFCQLYRSDIPKPKFLEEVVALSSSLSKEFAFARVDFIYNEKDLFVGEVTFAPAAGFRRYKGEADKRMGELLYLEQEDESKIYYPDI